MNIYIYDKVKGVMRLLPLHLFALLFLMVSCSETDDSVEEFANWRETNETFFNLLYEEASALEEQGSTEWKVFKKWSLLDRLISMWLSKFCVAVLRMPARLPTPTL